MKIDAFRELLAFLKQLDECRIAYSLKQVREDALMIEVATPGERWEIEFVDNGDDVQIEIERFRSTGNIEDESVLPELFAAYSDEPEAKPDSVSHEDSIV
jgi:hypothetical protein